MYTEAMIRSEKADCRGWCLDYSVAQIRLHTLDFKTTSTDRQVWLARNDVHAHITKERKTEINKGYGLTFFLSLSLSLSPLSVTFNMVPSADLYGTVTHSILV